jgi:ABC-type metal ion transport system substrate-binding protein
MMMLDRLGLLDLRPRNRAAGRPTDIRTNPRHLLFKVLTSWTLRQALDDFDRVF